MKAQTRKSSKGSTLSMVLTFLLFVGFMIGMVVMVYNQFLGAQKEAATAIDAAALQAAKDMSIITVDGPLGKLALVDNPAPTSNKYPVIGVNTVVATLRLDALIADKLGNKNMLYLVNQDAVRAVSAINQLRQKIQAASLGQGTAYDRNGAVVNMKQNAQTAYDSNAIRLGNKKSGESNTTIGLEIGTMTVDSTTGQTNVPTPSQPGSGVTDADINGSNSYVSNGISYYRPNVDIPIPGLTGSAIRLAPLSDSVSLADKAYFSKLSGTGSAGDLSSAVAQLPTCVQVTASENVNTMVPAGGVKSKSIAVQATATAGGQRLTAATGTMVVSFPQGFPANPTAQTGDSTPLTFNSVKSMMNAVQFSDPKAAQPTVDSNDEQKTYNGGSKGIWYKANGSNFPSSGSLDKMNFKGLAGREFDNPSVCMSFLVYDWLRSMGLRPNAKSVVDALSFDLKTYVNTSGSPKSFPISEGAVDFQPVYAQQQEQLPGILSAFMILNDGHGDPRDLTRWSQDPPSYSRQEVRMWGYIQADSVLPGNSSVNLIRPNGDLTTTDGNPISDLIEFDDAVSVTNNHAFETNVAVTKALARLCNQNLGTNIDVEHPELMSDGDKDKLKGPEGIAFAQKLSEQYPGLDNAWRNAAYCMQVTDAIEKNKKTLTGGGVKKIGANHFVVMGTDFFPATHAATESEIVANMAPTGQDSQAPLRNWCAPMKKGGDGNLVSQLVFYKRTQDPVIGRQYNHHDWLPPALAQGSIPANNMLKFMFHLGDPNTPNASVVFLHPSPNSPFAKVPTGNKQAEYQNTQAIKIESPSDKNVSVTWQFRARDNFCNAYEQKSTDDTGTPNPNSAATHFTAFEMPSHKRDRIELMQPAMADNYNKSWCSPDNNGECQPMVVEGAWTCPVEVKKPPPPSQNPPPPVYYYPPPAAPPPPPPCWTYSYFRVEPPWAAPGTIYALLYVSCRYYNGCGALINATHS